MPIGKIVEKRLVGLSVYDNNGLTQVVNVKYNGRKKVYRINLKDGFSIEATENHLICAHHRRRICKLNFVKVEDLGVGMYIRVYPDKAKTLTPKSSRNEKSEAALAGWLQADGFVGQYENGTNSSLTIEFMTVNEDEYEWVLQHIANVFPDLHYHVASVETKNDIDVKRIRLYGENLRPFVEKYELMKRKLNIRVPHIIWTANDDIVESYTKSVFQAEGYVCLNEQSHPNESARVAFAVISKNWVKDVQILLTRLGIYSRTRRKKEKRSDRHDLWELDIAILSERIKFSERIGFISHEKQRKLIRSCKLKGKSCPKIRYSAITSIEKIGEMKVYSIQTQSGHYLTNGILVHNCFINSTP